VKKEVTLNAKMANAMYLAGFDVKKSPHDRFDCGAGDIEDIQL
jgi:hypothetical protein